LVENASQGKKHLAKNSGLPVYPTCGVFFLAMAHSHAIKNPCEATSSRGNLKPSGRAMMRRAMNSWDIICLL